MRHARFVVGLVVLLAIARLAVGLVSGESGPPGVADANPPTGAILNPLPDSWQSNFYTYIQVRFTDPDGVQSGTLSVSVDGLSVITNWNPPVLYATAYGLPEGPHTAEARAWDQLGNGPTVLSWSFSTDTVRPEVEITNPVGNPVVAGGDLVMTWTGTDTGSGIDHYLLRLDDGPAFEVETATSFPFHNLEPGVHYFHLNAFDVAGNYAYYDEVAIATVPPVPPSSTNPANTTLVVNLPTEIPTWAVALIALNVLQLAAVVGFALRPRRQPPDRAPPNA